MLETKDCEHLINIIPQLSVCLLINLCMELGQTRLLCSVLEKVPAAVTKELLGEVVVYLQHAKVDEVVFNTYLWTDLILTIVTTLDVAQVKVN